jgi:triphosphoribosyl-dephospho-CoA synthase
MWTLLALKPGNVHIHAGGHRMTLQDFERSAAASAPALAAARASVGARVLAAVRARGAAGGLIPNHGNVHLCAPLAAAGEAEGPLWPALRTILERLDRADAADAFEAIRLASPAGLGAADAHDVRRTPNVDLLTAMRSALHRDRIARAYATGFEDVSGLGCRTLAAARRGGLAPEWCVTAVYLAFLATVPDTHIARKHGDGVAEEVRAAAARLREEVALEGAPFEPLLGFDSELKARGLNPGTSADFTVATLFADALTSLKGQHIRLAG